MSEREVRNDPPPVSPITVRIEINAETWEYVVRRLAMLADEAEDRDPSSFGMYGGGAGGAYHAITSTRDVSAEQYRAELDAWLRRGGDRIAADREAAQEGTVPRG